MLKSDGLVDLWFTWKLTSSNIMAIQYRVFSTSDEELNQVMDLVSRDLSEPYSVYVYRHFISDLPELCFVAVEESAPDRIIGCIVCNVLIHLQKRKRGYIAMLAVNQEYRGRGIGSELAQHSIQALIPRVDEIVLETEVTNKSALSLYENLGFIRLKRLYRYYLNGNDAFRLALPITEKSCILSSNLPMIENEGMTNESQASKA